MTLPRVFPFNKAYWHSGRVKVTSLGVGHRHFHDRLTHPFVWYGTRHVSFQIGLSDAMLICIYRRLCLSTSNIALHYREV